MKYLKIKNNGVLDIRLVALMGGTTKANDEFKIGRADKSLFDVVAILIEENEHFKTGLEDCSRGFQQHFINLYAGQLLKANKITL